MNSTQPAAPSAPSSPTAETTAPADHGFAPLPRGGRLAYEVRGPAQAPPLLLVRPLGGSMLLWGRFRDELARDFRVISYDERGAGASSAAPLLVTTRSMAADAVLLLAHLHLPAVHVFGLSLGGMVASWLAIDAKERVTRLVLASTAPRGLDLSLSGAARALSMALCLARPASAAEACTILRVLSDAFRREHPDEVRRILTAVRSQPASLRGLLSLVRAAAMHDARARLSEIRCPTLVLTGDHDDLLRRDAQPELERAVPHARFATIRHCGHDLSLEQPLRTAQEVRDFLHHPA